MFSPLQRLEALPNIIAVIIRLAFYSFFSLFVSLADTLRGSVLRCYSPHGSCCPALLFRRVSLRTRFCPYLIFFLLNFLICKGFTRLIFKLVYKLNICPLIQSDLAHNLELTPLMIVNT